MLGFRFNILALLNKFAGQEGKKLIPQTLKRDLWIWKKCIAESKNGFALKNIFDEPPLYPVKIISDAAGAALEWINGKSVNKSMKNDRGVASVLYNGKNVLKTSLLSWPPKLLMGEKTAQGTYFGTKSGTLEAIGLLLPFLSYPFFLKGKHILLQVANTSLVYGWQKRYCKNDPETSLLIRVLHVIEIFLPCKIYVKHVKRCSNPMARLVDQLSRKSSTTEKSLEKIAVGETYYPKGAIYDWLSHPYLDWSLPQRVIDDIALLLK